MAGKSDISEHRAEHFKTVKRLVVKVGSNVLTTENGLNTRVINSISRQIAVLMDSGIEVIVVSSGAMASGIRKMEFKTRPVEVPQRQAIAALGQSGLIMTYEKALAKHGKKAAQILLTSDGLSNRKRYLNARNTINTLIEWKVVPIVNENDTVAVEEIKFGDNDNLAAMITLLMDADILVNLTDIDGLFDKDPRENKDASLIHEVATIGKNIENYAGSIPGALGTGGMLTKIKAAKKTAAAGIPMVIAGGVKKDILLKLFEGRDLGTFFSPKGEKLKSRKCWIAFNTKTRGALIVDKGAQKAMTTKGGSLLPIGIAEVEGKFGKGDSVEIKTRDNAVIGVGLVNYSSEDTARIKGLKSSEIKSVLGSKPYDAVVHRDNLAMTDACSM